MTHDIEPNAPRSDPSVSLKLDRPVSEPAEKTEDVSVDQEHGRRLAETPTEPDASTEQQPT